MTNSNNSTSKWLNVLLSSLKISSTRKVPLNVFIANCVYAQESFQITAWVR